MANIRSLICLLTGHVDHGKSQIIESISGINIIQKEAGRITQTIYAVNVSIEKIEDIAGYLLKNMKYKINIPGFLLIDSPGHSAFSNLRKRGGSIADIGIVVIDVNEGIMPQTKEAVEILKNHKTPFIIALNKIDNIPGWKSNKNSSILDNVNKQAESVKNYLDTKLYEIVGKLYDLGFNAERFDRVEDYTKQLAIIPISAKTKEGIPELLMVLTGLAQKYLEKNLAVETDKPAKGVILEVRDEKGLGVVLDTIVYDGTLNVNDNIVIASLEEPIITKVRSLISLKNNVNSVRAAASVKISAPNIDYVIPGMPFRALDSEKNIERIKNELKAEIKEVVIETEKKGIIVKADSLGSLEALISILKGKNIKIRTATIGEITKKDISRAESEEDAIYRIIIGFNVKNVKHENVKIITSNVIYKLVEDYDKWEKEKKAELESIKLQKIKKPCKLRIMPGYVFRQNNPAVVGVEVMEGIVLEGTPLMKKDGSKITGVKSIQNNGKNAEKAVKGEQVAIALPNVTVGRQIVEGDILISDFTENEFKKLKEVKDYLNHEEIELLKEIAVIKRKQNSIWGL